MICDHSDSRFQNVKKSMTVLLWLWTMSWKLKSRYYKKLKSLLVFQLFVVKNSFYLMLSSQSAHLTLSFRMRYERLCSWSWITFKISSLDFLHKILSKLMKKFINKHADDRMRRCDEQCSENHEVAWTRSLFNLIRKFVS